MAFYKSAEVYYKEMTSTLNDVDTSKRSLIYNALMPTCYELSYQSLMLDEVTKMMFAKSALDNGYFEYLEKRCLEEGIERKLATTATGVIKVIGTKNSKLPNGSLISTSLGLTYTTQSDIVLDDIGIGYTNIIASSEGSKYNAESGEINFLPVKYEGILSIINEEKIYNGYDLETDEELYNRYLLKVQTPATSGNKYHYEQWALEVTGVGFAKCIPSPGNVKVIIVDSNKRGASAQLIQEVYDYIDNVRPVLSGTLTIVSAVEKVINVTVNVQLVQGYNLGTAQNEFQNLLEEYLKSIPFKSSNNSNVYVSIAKTGNLFLTTTGVLDYSDLKINNYTSNISLTDEEIAVLGTVSLGVI